MGDAIRDVTVRTNLQLGNIAMPDFRAALQPLRNQLDGLGESIASTVTRLGALMNSIACAITSNPCEH